MSSGTRMPGRSWVSSKPPSYVAQPGCKNKEGDLKEKSPNLSQDNQTHNAQPGGSTPYADVTWNTSKSKGEKPGILKKRLVKQNVGYSETYQDGGREVVATNLGGGVVVHATKSYDAVVAQRNTLLESDKIYRQRIKQLEEENAQILRDYEGIYKEMNSLQDKLDKGDDNHFESYQRVYADRQTLIEAEVAYKRKIIQLEKDAKEMVNNFETLYSENKVLRDKAKNLEASLNSVDRLNDVKKINALEKKSKLLEQTVNAMRYEREDLVKRIHELENKKFEQKENLTEMNTRNNLLQKENEGLKRGFNQKLKKMNSDN